MDNVITDNLKTQQERIRACARRYNGADDIQLVAVSKTQSAELIRAAYQAGQRDFGENYPQEAMAKQEQLRDLPLIWHFVGRVQSNKARLLAQRFDWVQTVASLKAARRLNEYREEEQPPLNICIQVNISEEETKSGCRPQEVPALCEAIQAYPRLRLRGIMAIPAYTRDRREQKRVFAQLRQLFERIKEQLRQENWDTLSMGMTEDLEAAIEEGATMVRLGTAIFGARS